MAKIRISTGECYPYLFAHEADEDDDPSRIFDIPSTVWVDYETARERLYELESNLARWAMKDGCDAQRIEDIARRRP